MSENRTPTPTASTDATPSTKEGLTKNKVTPSRKAPKNDNDDDDGGDINSKPHAVQIVSIGTEENAYAFTFHEDKLNMILSKIPPGWKVAVISVVGAFRTGKSFLLSWFLRYLSEHGAQNIRHDNEGDVPELVQDNGDDDDDGKKKNDKEAKKKTTMKWFEKFHSLGNDGFDWRGGAERNTTGIWMWSHPHFLTRTVNPETNEKEDVAIVLVDTQGMFDHETTMGLTAAIFGLSTLLSSYQIYNVDKRIQEDNLQQLALFSEYGRMALQAEHHHEREHRKKKEGEDERRHHNKQQHKPFQRIEFLVRDWQNFDDDDDLELMEKEMDEYLEKVIAERDAKDLQETREQITGCFDKVSCFMFTHPGFAVTKKKYSGDVSVIEETFLRLLDRYCHRVFGSDNLVPKSIHGRELTAAELGAYIKAYAKMFESGAHFPTASTMLEATASANNANATNLTLTKYKEEMDRIAGPHCSDYLRGNELEEHHREVTMEALKVFDSIANFGNQRGIDKAREQSLRQIRQNYEFYAKLNDSRNPLLGLETYIIPMSIALISFILRWVADFTCSEWSKTCRAGSDVLSEVYTVVVIFMMIVAATKAKQISETISRFKKAFQAMHGSEGGGSKGSSASKGAALGSKKKTE